MVYLIDVMTLATILTIATHGYMLIKGLGGMLHLGHAVFYGLGAYGAAILRGATIRPSSLHTLHSLQTVCVSQTRFAKKR